MRLLNDGRHHQVSATVRKFNLRLVARDFRAMAHNHPARCSEQYTLHTNCTTKPVTPSCRPKLANAKSALFIVEVQPWFIQKGNQ